MCFVRRGFTIRLSIRAKENQKFTETRYEFKASELAAEAEVILADLLQDSEADSVEGFLGDVYIIHNKLSSIVDDLEDLALNA